MFKFPNLKLYRKFLILAVLLGGLFIAAQSSHISAIPCCSACEEFYINCDYTCFVTTKNEAQYQACLHADCDPFYNSCMNNCIMSC